MRAVTAIVLFAVGLTVHSREALGQISLGSVSEIFEPIIRYKNSFFQMRVDQRVIIRLPNQAIGTVAMKSVGRRVPAEIKYKEQKIGQCLWIDKLAASRPGPKRSLELFTRDGAMIRAYLGDGCLAREFYAGAYMERPYDGKLCVDRDLLHARTGAKCEVDRFRLLIPR